MPFDATIEAPSFLRLEHYECKQLMQVLRDALCFQLFMLICAESDFRTGEYNGSYGRLRALCTPPRPERGRSRPGPSLKVVRGAIDNLVSVGLVKRDALQNVTEGTLRLRVKARQKSARSVK